MELDRSRRSSCGNEALRPSPLGCLQQRAGIAPARGTPPREVNGAEHDPAADPLLQPTPAFEFDRRPTW
jgi:hypothetical protein